MENSEGQRGIEECRVEEKGRGWMDWRDGEGWWVEKD